MKTILQGIRAFGIYLIYSLVITACFTTTKSLPQEISENTRCEQFTLSEPSNHDEINTNFTPPITFSWTSFSHQDFSHYLFRLYQGQASAGDSTRMDYRLIDSISLTTNSLAWPSAVVWNQELGSPPRSFLWTVSIIGQNGATLCPNKSISYFSLITAELDVENVSGRAECLDPAYQDGMVCYLVTESWEIKNTFSVDADLVAHTIIDNNLLPYTPTIMPAVQPLAVISAGTSSITLNFSYEICVPIGTVYIVSSLSYELENPLTGFDETSSDANIIHLPPCICGDCKGWRMNVTNLATTPFVHTSAAQDYLYLVDQLNVSPTLGNLVQVNAEIVHFEQNSVTNKQCETCNTKDNQHAVFVPYIYSGTPITEWISGAGWNSNFGTSDYNREVVWTQGSPSGIAGSVITRLTIGLPKFSELRDCCEDCFTIHIRYTFTAFDPRSKMCRKCSRVIRYRFCRNEDIPVLSDPQVQVPRNENFRKGSPEQFQKELENKLH